MRELKFKYWDAKANKWLADGTPMDLNYSGKYNAFFFDNDNFDIPKGGVWVQFTGLKTEDGKEIYEGDIIKRGTRRAVVVMAEDTACFEAKSELGSRSLYGWLREGYASIIGNKFENADLLTPEKGGE